jgi:hypothetical protein
VHVELYDVARGFESAGNLSISDSCLYHGRARNAFEEESPFIWGDSRTAYGKTIPLNLFAKRIKKHLEE